MFLRGAVATHPVEGPVLGFGPPFGPPGAAAAPPFLLAAKTKVLVKWVTETHLTSKNSAALVWK